MLDKVVSPGGNSVLEKSLLNDGLRHKIISNNIANAPGFKRSDVTFYEELRKTLAASSTKLQPVLTNPKHLDKKSILKIEPVVKMDTSTSLRTDGNNVDIDREMAYMAENQIHYTALAQKIAGFYTGMKNIIREGK